jgi:uncharacterized membrane protein YraQ (UPF0718 family)
MIDEDGEEDQFAEKITELLYDIHEEYGHLGGVFMGALFINGVVQTIVMEAKDKESAKRAAEVFCSLLRSSVIHMLENGFPFDRDETLQ